MYCSNCGVEIPDGSKFCPERGASVAGGAPRQSSGPIDSSAALLFNKKSEALALILSLLIPGLGQIYNGQTAKGVVMVVAAIIVAIIGVMLIIPLIVYIVLWIYGMYDAYTTAKEYNRYLLDHNGQPRGEKRHSARPSLVIGRLEVTIITVAVGH